jgi:uncharacterized glyoxalase superfamily protein PhnB
MTTEQLKAQQEFVNRSGACTCIVYHPVDEEYQRVFMEWTRTGKSSMAMAAQLFGKCGTR